MLSAMCDFEGAVTRMLIVDVKGINSLGSEDGG